MNIPFNPANWYWNVGNSATQVYSSAVGDYVPVTNPAYVAWGGRATQIDTEANLGAVLANFNQRPAANTTATNVLAGYQSSSASGVNAVILKILFNHENRIRTLAGQQTITAQQFITAIAALL